MRMALGRYNNKRDANEPGVFNIIRGYGMSVHSLDTPADAIVGHKGRTYLVEIKDGPKAKFTATQSKFQLSWLGDYIVLRTDEEAIAWCKAIRENKSK
jgi:hypothetical protein